MKIIFSKKKEVEFSALTIGQTFMDTEYDDCAVFMVVEPAIDVDITSDRGDKAQYAGYAVDLTNGIIVGYGSAEQVIPVDATLTAEGR